MNDRVDDRVGDCVRSTAVGEPKAAYPDVMVERWWRASRIAVLSHVVAVALLIAANGTQVIRSAVDPSGDMHGYIFVFSAMLAVMLVIPLLFLIAARSLIRRRSRIGLLMLGVYVGAAVALTVRSQSTAGAIAIVLYGVATTVIVVATAIRSWSEQQLQA